MMNNNRNNLDKSDPSIAPDNHFSPLFVLSHTFTSDMINNNFTNINEITDHNNNHNNGSRNLNSPSGTLPSTQYNNTQHNTLNRFANAISSPSLDVTSHTISIATLNVKGFTSNVFKFDAIIDDLFNKNLSI